MALDTLSPCKSDKMADFGSAFCWEWELLLGVMKGHVK